MTRFHIQFLSTWPGTAWVDDRRRAGQWCVLDAEAAKDGRPDEHAVVFNAETFDAALDHLRTLPGG